MLIESFTNSKLPKEFYRQSVVKAAPLLLGKLFCRNYKGKFYAGIITEVEAYDGNIDEAAHTYNGITERNRIMFREGGFLYVYFTYGMYFCCNVVFGKKGSGEAALIRAIEPVFGIEDMIINRSEKKPQPISNLTTGPGKISMAFGINKSCNGTDLCGNEIFICNYKILTNNQIGKSKRIGISKAKELLWRFYIKNSNYLSR